MDSQCGLPSKRRRLKKTQGSLHVDEIGHTHCTPVNVDNQYFEALQESNETYIPRSCQTCWRDTHRHAIMRPTDTTVPPLAAALLMSTRYAQRDYISFLFSIFSLGLYVSNSAIAFYLWIFKCCTSTRHYFHFIVLFHFHPKHFNYFTLSAI